MENHVYLPWIMSVGKHLIYAVYSNKIDWIVFFDNEIEMKKKWKKSKKKLIPLKNNLYQMNIKVAEINSKYFFVLQS